ncbi:Uncharacterised protein [Metakosakonia massiliensis]|uniref:Uncharacterized protein n=1 Tax=Phytobacter massiliensis TaxID=1485952 RepID=A0A6N3HUA9_9ENTR
MKQRTRRTLQIHWSLQRQRDSQWKKFSLVLTNRRS